VRLPQTQSFTDGLAQYPKHSCSGR
jgi:hypothetical protein